MAGLVYSDGICNKKDGGFPVFFIVSGRTFVQEFGYCNLF